MRDSHCPEAPAGGGCGGTPGGPENAPARIVQNPAPFRLEYNRSILLSSNSPDVSVTAEVRGDEAIEQYIRLLFKTKTRFQATVVASEEALAAETRTLAQSRLPILRTSHGLSQNLRNNAIYDRRLDWMLEAPEGVVIRAQRNADGSTKFVLAMEAEEITLVFRPRYYQKHKNIRYFQPWTYRINQSSITGWASWWAYFRECTQEDIEALMEAWNEKNLADYGFRYIQLDDVYQGGKDSLRQIPPGYEPHSYIGGRPDTWLEWKEDFSAAGMDGYVKAVIKAGFEPAVWMGCFFTDYKIAQKHPEWFIRGADGQPYVGKWVGYVLDASNPEVAENLIRPSFRGLKNAGFKYVKIDQLRHMLYDNLNHNLSYLRSIGKSPDDIIRAYLRIAREELGTECFILPCWGVLPEAVGLTDACRLGGDGYGPLTMQQYNSWNGIVWRNDPDHCDVSPRKAAKGSGNVREQTEIQAAASDVIIRPALASIAGCLLMLSDRPEVYRDDVNLIGARKSSPVLFSVPGQLYDFNPEKTDNLKTLDRNSVTSGALPGAIDAEQFGNVCPFWLNEYSKPYEHWHVLHRINWEMEQAGGHSKGEIAEAVAVHFADLGLAGDKEYLVYEFWSNQFIGLKKEKLELGELASRGVQSLAIREKLERPQLLSTTRHLSQGAAEIERMVWEENKLLGRSRLVVDDEYTISVYVPQGYRFDSAVINDTPARVSCEGELLKVTYTPEASGSVAWELRFV